MLAYNKTYFDWFKFADLFNKQTTPKAHDGKNIITFLPFNVFPRGPINNPTKLMSGYSSCGIKTLSLTRVIGGL